MWCRLASRTLVVTSAGEPQSLPDGGRFVALDSWRGIAALALVAVHVEGAGQVFRSALVVSGYLWVDFFFVLSGFVMAASYATRLSTGFPLSRFIVLRLGRVYPLHVVVLAIYLAMEIALQSFGTPISGARPAFSGGRSLGHLGVTLLLLNGFSPRLANAWNLQSWSISVEMALYLLIAAVWRAWGDRGWIVALAASMLAQLMLGLGLADRIVPFSDSFLRGVAGFGLGVGCWRLWCAGFPSMTPRRGTALEALCVLVALTTMAGPDPGAARYLTADAAFAALVVVFAARPGLLSRGLQAAPFRFLGAVSYSLYMLNFLVIARFLDLLRFLASGKVAMAARIPLPRIAAQPLTQCLLGLTQMAAAVACAWIAWRFVEWPARQWSRRLAARFGVAGEEAQAPTI